MSDGVVRGGRGGSGDVELVVVPDAGAATAALAELLAEAVEAGGSIVLAGGSTPRKAYELAATLDGDWGGVDLWFGDDRCVPADDPLSNQWLVRDALLDRIIVHPTLHAIATDLPANEAAAAYDAELRGEPLDLVLLGLGADGHTASLFPEAPTLDERVRLAVAAEPGLEPFVERVTMTIPALESGAHVVFLVVGEEKADAVRRAFAESPSTSTPASLVRSRDGRTTVILDAAAASLLS
jgi:6-phosphogluconolactonase